MAGVIDKADGPRVLVKGTDPFHGAVEKPLTAAQFFRYNPAELVGQVVRRREGGSASWLVEGIDPDGLLRVVDVNNFLHRSTAQVDDVLANSEPELLQAVRSRTAQGLYPVGARPLVGHDGTRMASPGWVGAVGRASVYIEGGAGDPAAIVGRLQSYIQRAEAVAPGAVDVLRQVNVYAGRSLDDNFWAQQNGIDNFTVAALGGRGEISFFNGSRNIDSMGVFAHELGHVAGLRAGPLDETAWRQAIQDDAGWRQQLAHAVDGAELVRPDASFRMFGSGIFNANRWGVTGYADGALGRETLVEDWAESFALWMLAAERQGAIAYKPQRGLLHRLLGAQDEVITINQGIPNRAALLEGWFGSRPPGTAPA